jgi:Dyp-type peroxidase family
LLEANVLEFSDTQGLVFSGYQQKPFASYLVLRVDQIAAARRWLRELAEQVTTGADRPPEVSINFALSAAGLQALGVDEDTLQTFPLEFREGMAASETRSRALGDTGQSHPSHWRWGNLDSRAHALLMVYAARQGLLDSVVATQRGAFSDGFSCGYERRTAALPERKEHFGFADGIAQPVIEGSRPAELGAASIKPGEFILGYPNEYGKLPFVPHAASALDVGGHLAADAADSQRKALGRNGSFLVVRELDQYVYAFWDYMRQAASRLEPGAAAADIAVRLAAKCVGRWPSGAPLVLAPSSDNPRLATSNDFAYAKDAEGARCPVGAHIRRSNPRDSLDPSPRESERAVNRHRILRRGRSYGPALDQPWHVTADDGVERGLFFMCVNANIRRQFEFVQQTWVNNPKFDGLYDERDPLLGDRAADGGEFTIPDEPARQRLEGMPRFVEVRGGEYFFLPSVRALKFLASLPTPSR